MNLSRAILMIVILALACVHRAHGDGQNWEDEFKKVYTLKDNEVIKRIEPPFIPERMDYYQHEFSSQAKTIPRAPTYFRFKWRDGKLKNDGYGFIGGKGLSFSRVLNSILDLPLYEFEGDKALLDTTLTGDWIFREEAPIEQKLQAVGDIFKKATGKDLAFTQQPLPRNVIVVSGNYTAETRDADRRMIDIHCYTGEKDPDDGGGGGSGTMDKFITRLGDLTGMATAIETPSRPIGTMSWRTHSSSYLYREPANQERDEKTSELLHHVAEQTGLEFKIEQRQVPVWVVKEESGE
jgi:hypothetical protein